MNFKIVFIVSTFLICEKENHEVFTTNINVLLPSALSSENQVYTELPVRLKFLSKTDLEIYQNITASLKNIVSKERFTVL